MMNEDEEDLQIMLRAVEATEDNLPPEISPSSVSLITDDDEEVPIILTINYSNFTF